MEFGRMFSFTTSVLVLTAICAAAEPQVTAGRVTLRLVPIDPPPGALSAYPAGTIVDTAGGMITLPGGPAHIWLEARWSAEGVSAVSYQAKIHSPDYGSGSGQPLSLPSVSCTTDQECPDAFGLGAECDSHSCLPAFWESICVDGGLCTAEPSCCRADQCRLDLTDCFEVSNRLACYSWLDVWYDPPCTFTGENYGGTFVLHASLEAGGTYTVGFTRGGSSGSFIEDADGPVALRQVIPATIEIPVGSCCHDFRRDAPRPPLPGEASSLVDADLALRTWPHRHGCDGFFAVRLVRSA